MRLPEECTFFGELHGYAGNRTMIQFLIRGKSFQEKI